VSSSSTTTTTTPTTATYAAYNYTYTNTHSTAVHADSTTTLQLPQHQLLLPRCLLTVLRLSASTSPQRVGASGCTLPLLIAVHWLARISCALGNVAGKLRHTIIVHRPHHGH
jgi:hypothetical protein